jgi:FkbM family methyltransferase
MPSPLETASSLLGAESVRACFDVGAFRGEYASEIAKSFPSATIYAYEPNPVEFTRLAATAHAHKRITAIPCGMGAAVSTAELHVTAGTASSSLLPLERNAATEWGQSLAESNRTTVDIVTIDSEATRLGLDVLDFLKIDAQGFEGQILAGGSALFRERRIRAVQIEILVERSYVGQALPHELLAQCHACGMRLRGIYDTYFRDSRLMQFDALLTTA